MVFRIGIKSKLNIYYFCQPKLQKRRDGHAGRDKLRGCCGFITGEMVTQCVINSVAVAAL
jgi:hypothetical protein